MTLVSAKGNRSTTQIQGGIRMHYRLPENHSQNKNRSPIYYLKVVLLGLSILAMMLVSGCSFDEPVLPSWTVTVNVPLENETFVLGEEIVNDSTIFVDQSDSSIFISIDGDLDTMSIDVSDFNLASTRVEQSFVIGNIQIQNLDALQSPVVTLGELLPSLEEAVAIADTVELVFPDTTLAPQPQQVNSSQFEALHIVEGELSIRFDNDLPVPIGPNASQPNGMEIALYDNRDTRIAVFTYDEVINPGGSATRSSTFGDGNIWMYTPLRIEYTLPFAEERIVQMTEEMLDSTGLALSVNLTSLEVDEAVAVIDPQEVERSIAFDLGGDDQLSEAVINQGSVRMSFTNHTNLAAEVDFTLPEFQDSELAPFASTIMIPERSTQTVVFDLAAMAIRPADPADTYVDSVNVQYVARTQSAAGMVQLSASDSIVVDISIDSLSLGSFSGYMAEETFEIEPVQEDDLIDYDDIPNNIRLSDVNLELTIANEVQIEDLFVNFYITGYHRDDNGTVTDSARLSVVNEQINPGSPNTPGITVISLSGNEVADFLNILPNSIRTWGDLRAGGEVALAGENRIASSYSFSTPLKFRIASDASVRGDVELLTEEDIDEDLQEAAAENLEEGHLTLSLNNHLPIGGTVRLIVSADPNNPDIYDITNINPELEFVKEISVQAAPISSTTGFVTQALQNTLELTLTKEEISLFQNPPLQFGYELVIDETSDVVAIRSSDYIQIGGVARIVVLVKED